MLYPKSEFSPTTRLQSPTPQFILERYLRQRHNLCLGDTLEQTTSEHHVPRSLSGPLTRRPEYLWHRGYGRWLDGWACRRLFVRRMQCARLPEERRSDPLQGLRSPCAVQGENEENGAVRGSLKEIRTTECFRTKICRASTRLVRFTTMMCILWRFGVGYFKVQNCRHT